MIRFLGVYAVCWALHGPAGDPEFLKDPQAQALSEQARVDFAAGRFDDAARALEKAYGIEPHPKLLVAWGTAQRYRGDCDGAVALYQRFLDTRPAPDQAQVVQQLAQKCGAQLKPPPDPAPPDPTASDHHVPPKPSWDDPAAEPTPTPALAPEPEPAPVQPRDTGPRKPWHRDATGGVLLGFGALMTAAGTGLLISAAFANNRANEQSHDGFRSDIKRARLMQGVGAGLFTFGALLGAGAALRYGLVARRNRRAATVWLDPTGPGIGISGRF